MKFLLFTLVTRVPDPSTPVAPVRAERDGRVGRSARGRRTALWQRALLLAPDVAGAGAHPALRRQIDAEGTA
ncbi:hypothetical protein IU459_22875 [Nocardia amamiensis]|uniref:Uncharacterized protein n=1 Tax=Nocardia amamiensis TaxID=404578 RepID=A0ABS0CW32_9NOCA|nr:hypothetical protein [Nocardia amamiensis]MBF6300365.1 hypothetical protein [Nocardia amamiensis]